mgnify:CR=1 FL=1
MAVRRNASWRHWTSQAQAIEFEDAFAVRGQYLTFYQLGWILSGRQKHDGGQAVIW